MEVGSLGVPIENDPWGRDGDLGKASQIAVFRRELTEGVTVRGSRRQRLEKMGCRRHDGVGHELLVRRKFGKETARGEDIGCIRKLVKEALVRVNDSEMKIQEAWYERGVAAACGGRVDVLVEALVEDEEIEMRKDEVSWATVIKWNKFVAVESKEEEEEDWERLSSSSVAADDWEDPSWDDQAWAS